MRTPLSMFLAAAVIASCSGGTESAATTVPTTAAPTTTTTTSPPTTTTLPPVTIEGAPEALAGVVTALLTGGATNADPALAAHLGTLDLDPITLTAHVGQIGEQQIAVVSNGDDALFAATVEGAWKIVAARLPSAGIAPWYDDAPLQLYVIGSDARPGEAPAEARADSHHIITIAGDGQTASIIGLPRDSYVTSPGGSRNKFTNLMPSYGPQGIQTTAEQLTGLDFEGYYMTGFAGFVDLVNAFGPFELDVLSAMSDTASKAYFDRGITTVDGADALAFSRNRKDFASGDFQRQENQGWLMQWGLKAAQTRGVADIPHLLELLNQFAATNIPAERQLVLAAAAMEIDDPVGTMFNGVIPGTTGTAGNASVVYISDTAYGWFAAAADGPVTAAELGVDG